jgi:hemerythrin-like domain-containing protein
MQSLDGSTNVASAFSHGVLRQVKNGVLSQVYAEAITAENMMSTEVSQLTTKSERDGVVGDGFDVLDACHREMLHKVEQLTDWVERLAVKGIDADTRATAASIAHFFSVTARQHHEDEERHVFPPLVRSGDPGVVHAVLRLQQDHGWLEEDWLELSPHLQAVAAGYNGYDIDVLREGAAIFAALTRDHVALEESFIYPNAREHIGTRDRREMGREMAARRRAERHARNAAR